MKYPLHTISQPVMGCEAKKIAHAIKSDGYVTNKAAIDTVKRITERRRLRDKSDASKR